jgi:aminopeptidase 2
LGQSSSLVNKTLDLLLSGKVRDQDIYIPIGGLRSSKEGIDGLWQWLQVKWDDITEKFPPQSSMISSIVSYCTSSLTKQEQLDAVNKFFADKDKKGYERSLAQSTDAITAKVQWVQRDNGDVRQWLGMK